MRLLCPDVLPRSQRSASKGAGALYSGATRTWFHAGVAYRRRATEEPPADLPNDEPSWVRRVLVFAAQPGRRTDLSGEWATGRSS